MKLTTVRFSMVLMVLAAFVCRAEIHYVNLSSPAPTPPYLDWATAAITIQAAVDSASPGDEILVTNGVYETGASRAVGVSSNRVAVTQAVTLRSVNGPTVTVIKGYQMADSTNGNDAVRCAYLTNGVLLSGFTLTNGATRGDGYLQDERSGGGVWCESGTVVISNCVICGNSADLHGGGAYRGLLTNCLVMRNTAAASPVGSGGGAYGSTLAGCVVSSNTAVASGGGVSAAAVFSSVLEGNSAYDGAGAYYSELYGCAVTANSAGRDGGGVHRGSLKNCTVSGNSAGGLGGGVYYGTPTNCIIYRNVASGASPDFLGSASAYYCCIPSGGSGKGTITADPLLASASHISADSPCRGAGFTNASGFDIDGEAWAETPSMGCDEPYPAVAAGLLTLSIASVYTNVAPGFALSLTAHISGTVSASRWEFGDGTVLSNHPYCSHAWTAPGNYDVILRAYNVDNPSGVVATTVVHVVDQVYYVAAANPTPAPPYSSWAEAANSIQEAIDVAAVPGALVLVTNGVYAIGGRLGPSPNLTTNRVAVSKPLILRSVNGPAYTVIRGYQLPLVTNGDGAIRCIYLTNDAVLIGFTLTNGATVAGQWNGYQCGGGAYCEASAVISNCVLTGNSSAGHGGGVEGGTVVDCTIVGNSAASGGGSAAADLVNCLVVSNSASFGGGAEYGILTGCRLSGNVGVEGGGGAAYSTLSACTVAGNYAAQGGGILSGTLFNCDILDNSGFDGGGGYGGTLNNCTLIGNSAQRYGNGAFGSTLNNSIAYYNSSETNHHSCTLNYCCTLPQPSAGTGNFTNEPRFVDLASRDTHLQSDSPCINSGGNTYVSSALDFDSQPRIVGELVDVGALEYQSPASVLPYVWLYQYGLPLDGSADFTDTDGDKMNNWQEWVAGVNPTNAASVLTAMPPTRSGSGIMVTWKSALGVRYFVQRSSNLSGPFPFSLLASNIFGWSGTTSYRDGSATNGSPYFYRVGVWR